MSYNGLTLSEAVDKIIEESHPDFNQWSLEGVEATPLNDSYIEKWKKSLNMPKGLSFADTMKWYREAGDRAAWRNTINPYGLTGAPSEEEDE